MNEMNKIEDDTLNIMKKIEEFKQWNKLYNSFNKIDNAINLNKLEPNTLNYDVLLRIKKWAYNIMQGQGLTNEFLKEYMNKLKAYNELAEFLSDPNF